MNGLNNNEIPVQQIIEFNWLMSLLKKNCSKEPEFD